MGGRIDATSPAENRRLFRRILERGGAIVSEHPPGEGGRPSDHADRNRFIAAAAESLWVAEAGLRSGTLGTARWASRLNRPIWVSPPTVSGVRAGLELLRENGAFVGDVFHERAVAATLRDRYADAAGVAPSSTGDPL
ncbi:MAG: DNA-processing protein DprA [Myxococcota bacterium]